MNFSTLIQQNSYLTYLPFGTLAEQLVKFDSSVERLCFDCRHRITYIGYFSQFFMILI